MLPRKGMILLSRGVSIICRRFHHKVGILGAPLSRGQEKEGVKMGPDALRKSGLLTALQTGGCNLKDYGNLTFEDELKDEPFGTVKMPRTVGKANAKLFEAVKKVKADGRLCVILGGDHRDIIKKLGIKFFSMTDVNHMGIQKVMEMINDYLYSRVKKPIHLSFDIDGFDPVLAPATGTPVEGGLTYEQGIFVANEIHKTGLLSAIDLVEVNPSLGKTEEEITSTVNSGRDIILKALGYLTI